MSTDKLVAESRRRYVAIMANRALEAFELAVASCESPIEQLLLGEMLALGMVEFAEEIPSVVRAWAAGRVLYTPGQFPSFVALLNITADADCCIFGQFPLAGGKRNFRLDFAIAVEWWSAGSFYSRWVAVECDGHDYHERTKTQAAHDRSKDRALTASGWTVVRFTGSELYANAYGCVQELERIVLSTRRA
jgi:hypothetical protein